MEWKRTLVLENRQGERQELLLRGFRAGDEQGMIACIREEYGATYFKQELYQPEYIKRQAEEGRMTFLVAETKEGEIAGMMLLKQFRPEETMCEVASQIFKKKYRGMGLAAPFFEYGMGMLLQGNYSAAFCLPVLFHDVTQRLLYRQGLRATGLILNVFDMKNITHSYSNGRNRKHSQGIQIMAMGKRNAGCLYVSEEHKDFCTRVYESLGVNYHFSERGTLNQRPMSEISVKNDALQHSLEIRIRSVGADLQEKISEIYEKYPLKGTQTAVIFLNCNDPDAVWAYEILKNMGHFFTGLKPLCSEKEYMVLHHAGEVEIYFKDYRLSEEFTQIADYVKQCYNRKTGGREE